MPSFPYWQDSAELIAYLDTLPDRTLNRALYELLWQCDSDHNDAHLRHALFALLAHPRYRSCPNLHHWITDLLHGGLPWRELLPHIRAQLGHLHHDSCRAFGDHGGMFVPPAELAPVVEQLFAHGSDNASDILWSCLYWSEDLRAAHPDWAHWLQQRIAALPRTPP